MELMGKLACGTSPCEANDVQLRKDTDEEREKLGVLDKRTFPCRAQNFKGKREKARFCVRKRKRVTEHRNKASKQGQGGEKGKRENRSFVCKVFRSLNSTGLLEFMLISSDLCFSYIAR